ncbi:UNVERIFIED_CONTAM: hypothetical protein GTU68_006116 [Idotea baltica]|nr:hypothetical protein [Idotea baltica]
MSGLDDVTEPATPEAQTNPDTTDGPPAGETAAPDGATIGSGLFETPSVPAAEPESPAEAQSVAEPEAALAPEVAPQVEAAPEPEPAVAAAPASAAEPEATAAPAPESPTEASPSTEAAATQPVSSTEAASPAAASPEIGASAPGTPASGTPASDTPAIGATAPAVAAQAGAEAGAGETTDGAPPPPSAAPRPKPVTETGKILEGLVTAVNAEGVELTLDDGRLAVIHRRNFGMNDEDPATVVAVGDRAHGAELLREDPKGRVVLSRAWALKRQSWEKIVTAAANNELLSGKIVSASKKGLVVDVGVRGFIPSSHMELTTVTDMSPYVGQTYELKILEVDPRREKLVLSRRSLLMKAQRKEMQQLLGSLKPGEIRTGTVASLADYGAFVDLGGVSGLVHISELSWNRVSKPSQVVKVGDEVEVKILDVKPKKKRISLSMRQLTADPLSTIEVGAVLTGKVTRLVDFGAFVAIGEFEGLVHLSELAEYRVSTPEEIVAPGDEVGVKILSVDTKRRRIELSIRRAAEYGG